MIDVRRMMRRGRDELSRRKAEKEAEIAGHPRVGSIGIQTDDGEVFGVCHRIAMARSLGIEKPAGEHTQVMWNAGEANETTWEKVLQAAIDAGPDDLSYSWPVKLLRHDEVPVKAEIPGVDLEVLGHPDVVMHFGRDKWLGLELKGIFGYYTATQIRFDKRPKNENLIQAAGYSYFKKIPYALCYTLGSYVKLMYGDAKKYGVRNIEPFEYTFYMEWRDDVLWYRGEDQEEWTKTNITPKAIERYYQLVQDMKANKHLGPRPSGDYVDGTPAKWDNGACGLCEFARACNRYDLDPDFGAWIEAIKSE